MARSQQVANDLPHLKEDILCRVDLMTTKWNIIQKKDKGMHSVKNVFEIGGAYNVLSLINISIEN